MPAFARKLSLPALVIGTWLTASSTQQVQAQAVAFSPVSASFPNGVQLNATPVVSADRRYVRMSLNPQFTALEGFNTYTIPIAAVAGGGGGGLAGSAGLAAVALAEGVEEEAVAAADEWPAWTSNPGGRAQSPSSSPFMEWPRPMPRPSSEQWGEVSASPQPERRPPGGDRRRSPSRRRPRARPAEKPVRKKTLAESPGSDPLRNRLGS